MSSNNSSGGLSVSVIIPSYNRAKLLPRAIDSLLDQTRRPDQIIVVDDASTDNTSEVLASYRDEILAVEHQVNRGLSGARNTGIQHVSGEVVTFLDSDDILLPASIEKRLSLLESLPDVSVVYSDVMLVDEQGKALARYSQLEPGSQPSGNVFHEFILHNLMPVHGFMFRRSCLDKVGVFDIQIPQVADYDFWLRMASHFQFLYLDEPLAYYYVHSNMMTKMEQPEMQQTWLKVHRRIFDMTAFNELTPYQKSRAYSTHGTRYAQQGDIRQARHWYRRALTTAPFSPRPYLLLLLTMLGKVGFNWIVKRFRGLRRRTAEQVFG
jgi:glycosyltransferase involved in cell wall biosynthesis